MAESNTNTSKDVTPERIMQFVWGYAPTLIIETALHFQIFDRLEKSSKTVAELAGETGASQRGLLAILDALVGLQLLSRSGHAYAWRRKAPPFSFRPSPAFKEPFSNTRSPA